MASLNALPEYKRNEQGHFPCLAPYIQLRQPISSISPAFQYNTHVIFHHFVQKSLLWVGVLPLQKNVQYRAEQLRNTKI